MTENWIPLREAARISRRTLTDLHDRIRSGALPAVKVEGDQGFLVRIGDVPGPSDEPIDVGPEPPSTEPTDVLLNVLGYVLFMFAVAIMGVGLLGQIIASMWHRF